MKRIKSFELDHDSHKVGIYLSSIMGDIYTYDIRMKMPNDNDYLTTTVAHTIEHLFATVIRNSYIADRVIYFGPMGCRTGCYLLLRNTDLEEAKNVVLATLKDCLNIATIPGSTKKECGNYLDHDLMGARQEIQSYLEILQKN